MGYCPKSLKFDAHTTKDDSGTNSKPTQSQRHTLTQNNASKPKPEPIQQFQQPKTHNKHLTIAKQNNEPKKKNHISN